MQKTLFDFKDYRPYLKEAFPTHGTNRGSRARLAAALGVWKGFVSSVIHGDADFSLEQAYRVSHHLSHTDDEREYFLLLILKARAGSKDLEKHFAERIDAIQKKREEIRERIGATSGISDTDKMTYYSSWHYTAMHMCLMVPALQTPPAMAKYLGVPLEKIAKMLEFFIKSGLAEQKGNTYVVGPTRIHISSDSPFVSKHHSNWRMQAIQALDRDRKEDLHYSSVMSISKEAAENIRELILRTIEETEPIIREAKDERIVALTFDLFDLKV
jgi:uncharacterized protein (TIGR02147 family)